MKEKNNMLVVLEQYKLKTPDADTKTMPQGLRREVRHFVHNYVGHYTSELRTVKQLKKKDFFNKHESQLRAKIMNDSSVKCLLNDFKGRYTDFKSVYLKVLKEDSLDISGGIYGMERNEEHIKIDIKCSWVDDQMNKEFDKLYGAGFVEFSDILSKFEKKIEEAVIFATITEVYKIILEYAKFKPYLEKLSSLQIK